MIKEDILSVALADKEASTSIKKHIVEIPTEAFKTSKARKLIDHFKNSGDIIDLETELTNHICNIMQSDEYKVFISADKEMQLNTVRSILDEYKKEKITLLVDDFSLKMLKEVSELDPLITKLVKGISGLPSIDGATTSEDAVMKVLAEVKDTIERGENPVFETNYRRLNKAITGGFRKGDLTTILGTSGLGKTTFVQNLARDFTLKGYKILYITTEMQDTDLIKKFICMKATEDRVPGFSLENFSRPTGDDLKTITYLSGIVSKYDIDYEFCADPNKLSFICNKKDYDIVIVDHLHDMEGVDGKDSNGIVADILGSLKNWAINSDGLCLVLAQPRKKSVDKDKESRLSVDDIRGSQAIQSKSSQILILHRDRESSVTEIEVSKNRWGAKDSIVNFTYDNMIYKEQ